MANKAQQQLQLVLQPLVDGEIDDEILSYIAGECSFACMSLSEAFNS